MEHKLKRIILGVTGAVAAYKAAVLARLLVKDGLDVQVVMTEAARHFVGAATFQAITGHPVFTAPNRIGEADWSGWVQERNLYAFTTFDPQFVPLLESADPGEPPQTGGQVYARIGKGHYVYAAYAFFRQLPAGVPGAYRLFANLLSLGHDAKK